MKRTIVLQEYQPQQLSQTTLTDTVAERLWYHHARLVAVEFPTLKTDNQWQLTAQGWVGLLPVTPTCTIVLEPKVPIANLLQMLDLAYGLQSVELFDGTVGAITIPELYEQLVLWLVKRILTRCRQGLYRPYQLQQERIPYVRGRLTISELMRAPTATTVPCCYGEQSVDVVDNQLLLWTLHSILQGGLCREPSAQLVQQAYRILRSTVSLVPLTAADCRGRLYSRLHTDYAPIHALCALFLEASSPSHLPGNVESVPFVVNMARLYEQCVAAWLQKHLPATWQLQMQERHVLSDDLYFAMDIVLYDRITEKPLAILDTKYKTPEHGPATADVAQVVAYAAAKGATRAILIYPQRLPEPLNTIVGRVHVQTVAFPLDVDINQAGQNVLAFLNERNLNQHNLNQYNLNQHNG